MNQRGCRRRRLLGLPAAVWGALLCLLCPAAWASDAEPWPKEPRDFRQKFPLTRDDFVVSMPVDQKHLTVAKGSRAWRKARK